MTEDIKSYKLCPFKNFDYEFYKKSFFQYKVSSVTGKIIYNL